MRIVFIALASLIFATPALAQRKPLLLPTTRLSTTRFSANRSPLTRVAAPPKYQKSTPAQDAAAIAQARAVTAEISKSLEVKFVEIQTAHFLIFTNWPANEHAFLKQNLEAAYAAVSKAFEIPVNENIFVGKLPVYMFDQFDDFKKFAQENDELSLNKSVTGYFGQHTGGGGHLAMWKPEYTGPQDNAAIEKWAYTLTHEFTHAFVARYKTDRSIPTWLNEGIAEVIACSQFPRNEVRAEAKYIAAQNDSVAALFEENGFKGGESYPLMQTIVETLVYQNRKGFLDFFDAIKEGMKPEAALKKVYGWSYEDLEKAWRDDLQRR